MTYEEIKTKVNCISLIFIALISAIALTSCSDTTLDQNKNGSNSEYTAYTESTTETAKITQSTENATATSAKATQTISFDKFSVQIPSDFNGIIDEKVMGIYSTPYQYQMKLSDEADIFFGWGFEGMYPADTGNFDETASEIAERHQKMCFGFETEGMEYAWQHPFFLNPNYSNEFELKGCSFVHQTGTMKRDTEDEQSTYYYEAYFGNVPYKNSEFNIYQAPAFWIAFTNEQNNQATKYVHTLIKQVADSFSY